MACSWSLSWPRAVSMMIGIAAVSGCWRSAFTTSIPVMPGIIQSSTMRSNFLCRTVSSTCLPLVTWVVLTSGPCSVASMSEPMLGSSSAISMWFISPPAAGGRAGSSPFHRQDDTFPPPGNELHQENGANNFHFGKQWGRVLNREVLGATGPGLIASLMPLPIRIPATGYRLLYFAYLIAGAESEKMGGYLMPAFGSFALLLALALSGYSFVAGVFGLRRSDGMSLRLSETARRAGIATFIAVAAAAATLLWAAFHDDFSVAYILHHSNRDLPAA